LPRPRWVDPLVAVEDNAEHHPESGGGQREHRSEFDADLDAAWPPGAVQVITSGWMLGDDEPRFAGRDHAVASALSGMAMSVNLNGGSGRRRPALDAAAG
jgi:hypothetical protein